MMSNKISIMPHDPGSWTSTKILVPYTDLNGNERADVCMLEWLVSFSRTKMKKLKLKRRFPFIGIETVEYTDTLLNSGTSQEPEWMHLHSLESPGLMAKKFGIQYIDPAYELVKEQVEKP